MTSYRVKRNGSHQYWMPVYRVERSRSRGWRLPENTVCVTRPGKWGNIFPVSVFGRERAVELYSMLFRFTNANKFPVGARLYVLSWVEKYFKHTQFLSVSDMVKNDLKGKNLACWCKKGEKCHADILLHIANQK